MFLVSWGGVCLEPETSLLFLSCTALAWCVCIQVSLASQEELGKALSFVTFSKNIYEIGMICSIHFCVECLSAIIWPGIFTVLGLVNFLFPKSVLVKFCFAIIYLFHLKFQFIGINYWQTLSY